MEYIDFEAKEILKEEEIISFSGEENDEDNISFIEDGKVENQEPSFYRKFFNQTRDPAETVYDDDKSHLDTRDLQPEMFFIEDRGSIEFDEFEDSSKCAEQFKKAFSLLIVTTSRVLFYILFCTGLYLSSQKKKSS